MNRYENLDVFVQLKDIIKEIYKLTQQFPNSEKYNLGSQIRRASISSVSNLIEGLSRQSDKEKIRFIEICYGSLMECDVQLLLSSELGLIDTARVTAIRRKIDKASRMLSGLRKYYLNP
jgi:four helix bundle protein